MLAQAPIMTGFPLMVMSRPSIRQSNLCQEVWT
jgi:hypothetical protein